MKHRVSGIIVTLLACLLLETTAAAQSDAEAQPPVLSFGVVPQQAPSKLLQSWGPLLRLLEERTGYRFAFRTAPDIPTFEQRLAAGEYDFAYMNPYHFTVFNRGDQGYQAVARAKDKLIRGIVVARRDATLQTLTDLEGATIAFPAPAAFAASVLPRAHLRQLGVNFGVQYVSSHDSVYTAVARGLYPAGGGVERTLNAIDPALREQLRILWTTPGYTSHAIAVHPRIAQDTVGAMRQTLTAIADDEAGRAALDGLKIKGFAAAKNDDWDDVRALKLEAPVGSDN